MFNKILAPLDGSTLATCVLPHVVAMTRALGADLTLLRLLERHDAPGNAVDPVDWQLHKTEAQIYLNALGVRVAEHLGQPPNLQMLEGPAAKSVIEYAQNDGFDLVALSSHGLGGLTGWNVSSMVQKVIDRVRKSILLVRADEAYSPSVTKNGSALRYRRILIPLDGSQRAEFVLPMVAALAHYHEAEILLVHVIAREELSWRMPLRDEDTAFGMERSRSKAIQSFQALQARLPLLTQLNIQVSTNVAAMLHSLVEQEKADLVVLSAHDTACHPQSPYGSITASFLAHGTTTLLIMQDLPPHEIPLSKAKHLAANTQPRWDMMRPTEFGVQASASVRQRAAVHKSY